VTVFAPDDLALIKAGPQGRRGYLDDLLAALHPRHDNLRGEVERIVRQRNALLKQTAGNPRPPAEVLTTLDVWDQKLAESGEALADARHELVAALGPRMGVAYAQLAEHSAEVAALYQRSWTGSLVTALASSRMDDLRRGVTTVGPHHDDLLISLGGLPSRTHASQGEQRSLALALRLAGHRVVVGSIGSPPVLLLDDVFSELDGDRAEALLGSLPECQILLTTTGMLPPRAQPALVLRVEDGKVLP
jgi:DNA replication and repair protein RecF